MSNHVHILLCSGALGLAKFMRRLLIGYAVSYNLQHRRHGHVFQNRYKSIVCDGDRWTGTMAGDWFAVRSQRAHRARELSDGRILGSGEFVERILREADARALRQYAAQKGKRYAERVLAEECKKSGVSLTELRSGSRRGRLPAVRTKIVRGLVENYR